MAILQAECQRLQGMMQAGFVNGNLAGRYTVTAQEVYGQEVWQKWHAQGHSQISESDAGRVEECISCRQAGLMLRPRTVWWGSMCLCWG